MTSDASEKVEEFDEDINTTAPQEKSSVWKMPAPVFRKTSGKLPKDFEKRSGEVGAVKIIAASDQPSSVPEPLPKSPALKIVVVLLALGAMVAFLILFLTVVYFFFLRANVTD